MLIYSRDEKQDLFDKNLREFELTNPSQHLLHAQIHAYRSEKDLAFQWLEKGLKANDPEITEYLDLKYDPFLKNLFNDSRWTKYLVKLGYPSELLN